MNIKLLVKILKKVGNSSIIINILLIIVLVILIMYFLFNVGVIDVDNEGLTSMNSNINESTDENVLDDGSNNIAATDSSSSLLESAEKIDGYMSANEYYYPESKKIRTASYDSTYDSGSSKAVCCATFVSWCLQDAGFISKHVDSSVEIYNMLNENSDWTKIEPKDFSDLKQGDVCIYYDDVNQYKHSNIYSGNNTFWDEGSNLKVKDIGATSNKLPTYAFRYTK